ncbi:hypothetical protein N9O61_03865 [Octadecabacter sp.]|nr:hypothetical protein [Octadecabacter sp.]
MSKVVTPVTSTDFAQAWQRCFGKSPPFGHILRQDFFDHWTRFHALPEAKRYADSEDEWSIVISRANRLTTECFGARARVWLATAYFNDMPPKENNLPVSMNMAAAMTWIDQREEPEDQSEITFFAIAYDWTTDSLDELFGEIANDQVRAVLFSEEKQTVLAPYDGGFDVICLQPRKLSELEGKFRDWMSNRRSRL